MNDQAFLNEQLTRHLIHERVARAAEPHLRTPSGRHRLASSLHRWAERLEA